MTDKIAPDEKYFWSGIDRKNKGFCFENFYFDGKSVEIFLNGSIDNYNGLSAKFEVEISSETHLIALLYLRYGANFVEQINGTFIIVCKQRDVFLIYRSHYEQKPIYYTAINGQLMCSFDFKSLLPFIEHVSINPSFLSETLLFGFQIRSDETPFNQIKQLPKGSVLRFMKNDIKISDFAEHHSQHFEIGELPFLLKDAISGFLSYHPKHDTCVCLSGGLDSSVVALLSSEVYENMSSYTLVTSSNTEDGVFADKVAKRINSEHHIVSIGLDDLLHNIVDFIFFSETICISGAFSSDNGDLAQYILLNKIKEHFILSGDGADELFCGYSWSHENPSIFVQKLKKAYETMPKTDAIDDFFSSPLPDEEKVYDLLLNFGLSHQSAFLSKLINKKVFSPFLTKKVLSYAKTVRRDSISRGKIEGKTIMKDALRELMKFYDLSEIVDRKKFAMPSSTACFIEDFHENLSRYATSLGAYAQYFSRKYEKFLFDVFVYIFVVNRGKIPHYNVDELVHKPDFTRMYD